MLTRRRILTQGLKTSAAFALGGLADLCLAQQTGSHPDEMTINTAQGQQVTPTVLGPPPATLPPEAEAVRGPLSLQAHAQAHGLLAGAAVVVHELERDPAMQQLLAEQYGIVVPENELKWVALRPAKDRFDFTQSDAFFDFARARRLQARGHTMVWHNSVPDWLKNGASQLDVRQLLIEHIHTVIGRYRGRAHSWDIVNEAILPADGLEGNLRKSFWYDHIGPDYIEIAFRAAREADPHLRLSYNDYAIEHDNPEDTVRRNSVLVLLQRLQKHNVPIDAVGIQGHIKAGPQPPIGKGLADFIESARRMGLEVYITEMDVNEDDLPFDDVKQRDAAVARTYHDFLHVALPNPAVKAVLTWGVSDRRTWLNEGPSHQRKHPNRPQRALPFDREYRPKDAFFAIRDSFDERKA